MMDHGTTTRARRARPTLRRRPALVVAAVAVAASLLSACDPTPPAAITVTTLVDGTDVAPGDGVCEMTAGVGDCSLRAAVAEAAALGRADLILPSGTFVLTVADPTDGDADLDVTGAVRVNRTIDRQVTIQADSSNAIEVHAGGRLEASGLTVTADAPHSALLVAGSAVLDRTGLSQFASSLSFDGPAVDVAPSGALVLSNSAVWGVGRPAAVANRGSVAAGFSSLYGLFLPGLHTAEGATTLAASIVSARIEGSFGSGPSSTGPSCVGLPPVSRGHNWVNDLSCDLSGTGDVQGPGSSWVDIVPVGTLGCGSPYATDGAGRVRPLDGNDDGVAACEAGAAEDGLVAGGMTLIGTTATQGRCYVGRLSTRTGYRSPIWTVTGLPPGLSVTGNRIIGAATESGTFPLDVRVVGQEGGGRLTTTLTVAAGTPPWDLGCS